MAMRRRKHLLIAFDAFGTLFSPRAPIAIQYAEVARRFGITGLKSEDLESAFKKGALWTDTSISWGFAY
jgi:hypothetical protein